MDALKNLFGGGQQASQAPETTSLLSDWQSYNKTPARDVESGPSTSDALFQNVEKAGTSVSGFFKDSFTTVKQGVQTGVAALPTAETFRCTFEASLMQLQGRCMRHAHGHDLLSMTA